VGGAQITVEENAHATLVPTSAVLRRGEGWAAFVIERATGLGDVTVSFE